MSNSNLVSYTKISPNKTSPRNHVIDTVTIHCVVGQVTVERLGAIFAPSSRQASCNYGIGLDGKIGMYVEEKDRSWCSSNAANDHRAITIEVASDTTHPYKVTDAAYKSLINLLADICKRNSIKELKWKGDKSLIGQIDKQNMTVHRWFANKSCPGDYLYNLHGQIAAEVNAKLGTNKSEEPKRTDSNYPAVPFKVQVLVDDLNYRSEPSMDGKVKGQTGKGVFTITEVDNSWGKLASGAGWIWLGNSSYCRIKDTIKTDDSFVVQVDITDLNVRTGPGTNYAKTGGTTGKGRFTITEVKEGPGSDSGWGKLKSGAGWISLDYATRVK